MYIESPQSFLDEFKFGREAADMVGISHNWLYELKKKGRVTCYKVGDKYVFHVPTLKNELFELSIRN